jgi:hypothetical protein
MGELIRLAVMRGTSCRPVPPHSLQNAHCSAARCRADSRVRGGRCARTLNSASPTPQEPGTEAVLPGAQHGGFRHRGDKRLVPAEHRQRVSGPAGGHQADTGRARPAPDRTGRRRAGDPPLGQGRGTAAGKTGRPALRWTWRNHRPGIPGPPRRSRLTRSFAAASPPAAPRPRPGDRAWIPAGCRCWPPRALP